LKDNQAIPQLQFLNSTLYIVIHATEDKDKILDAVLFNLEIPKEKFQEIESEGHWGNKIVRLITEINKKDTQILIEKILKKISFIDRNNLLSNLDKHIDDKGNLFLRLDKQRICRNKISLSDTEGIKIKFKMNKNPLIISKKSGKIESEVSRLYRRLIQSLEK
jgi:RNA-binding protein